MSTTIPQGLPTETRDRLRYLLAIRGIPPRTFARRADVPYLKLQRYITGVVPWIDVEIVVKCAKALGVSVDFLTGTTDDAPAWVVQLGEHYAVQS